MSSALEPAVPEPVLDLELNQPEPNQDPDPEPDSCVLEPQSCDNEKSEVQGTCPSKKCIMCYRDLEISNTSESDELTHLEDQLSVIFFLKSFLKYPLISEDEGVFESMLTKIGNPSQWIKFCPICSKTVHKGLKLYRLLTKVELHLEKLRETVEIRVADSFKRSIDKASIQDIGTFSCVRQVIYENKLRKSYLPNNGTIVKEEPLSDDGGGELGSEFGWPNQLEPKIDDNIIIPESLLIEEDVDWFQDDISLSSDSGKRRRTSISKRGRKRQTSFRSKYTPRGPKKSSIQSRTCPLCKMVFTKPSLMARHFKTHGKISTRNQNLKRRDKHLINEIKNDDNGINDDIFDQPESSKDDDNDEDFKPEDYDGELRPKSRKRKPVLYKDTSDSENEDKVVKPRKQRRPRRNMKDDNSDGNSDYSLDEGSAASSENEIGDLEKEDDIPKVPKVKGKLKRRNKSLPEQRTCPVCQKVFNQPCVMLKHMKCAHKKEDNYICEICGKKYTWPNGLSNHMRRHKEAWVDVRPFKCEIENCNKTFRFKCELQRHEKMHNAQKDFLCSLCGSSFVDAKGLKRHEIIHTDQKPYECTKCGEKFRHKHNLLRHDLYKHQDDAPKPFVCEQCGKSFKVKMHLDQHLKSKTHGGSGFSKPASSRNNNSNNTPRKRTKKIVVEEAQGPHSTNTPTPSMTPTSPEESRGALNLALDNNYTQMRASEYPPNQNQYLTINNSSNVFQNPMINYVPPAWPPIPWDNMN